MKPFSFERQAKYYPSYSHIQQKVAKDLLQICKETFLPPKTILDLGAGSGNVLMACVDFTLDLFVAIDKSQQLLSLHPKDSPHIKQIELICCDFEKYHQYSGFDWILSSSSLHWASDLENIFHQICTSANPHTALGFAFFTNKSLESLHNFLGTTSPLRSTNELLEILAKYFSGKTKIAHFREDFGTKEAYLAYLKHCGLLGGGTLPFQSKKRLKFELSLTCVEFEVLFFVGNIKQH